MRWTLIVTLVTAVFLPGTATADNFYVCTKRTVPHENYVNESAVAEARRNGWRCRKRMQFPDRPSASASTRSSGNTTRRAGTRSKQTSTSRSTPPRRFLGPAGQSQSFEPYIVEAAQRYNVPADLVRAIIRTESNFRPSAVSSAGAVGLMQLMPGTARDMGVSDSTDPRQNILGGVRYFRVLLNRFDGDARLAIAGYHAGPNAVAARGDIPYEATARYVRAVMGHYLRYRNGQP